ncbi:MAG: hypothetical protein IJH18_04260 [Bacilli bacterium]|nr:hypothetical protein [Bacilli bacterium]
MEKIKKDDKWYNNPNLIILFLIALSAIIILSSQSFAVKNNMDAVSILRSLLNHNTIYFMSLAYFIILQIRVGKKYFNFLNVLLIIVYFIMFMSSLFTVFQSFGLAYIVELGLHLVILLYLIYTFIKETKVWRELKLNKVPFDEIGNDMYFYLIAILSIVALVVNLIDASNFDEVCVSLLGSLYYILFGRYIYLYKAYSDSKKKAKEKKKIKE